ncbi:MAG: hypothetical protein GY780_01790 [bacterium]|nr:hypothetical protein [bacterium]
MELSTPGLSKQKNAGTIKAHKYLEKPHSRLSLGYSKQEFNVFSIDRLTAQREYSLNDVCLYPAVAGYDQKSHEQNTADFLP